MSKALEKIGRALNELPWRVVGSSASVGRSLFGSRHAHPLGILTYHRVVDLVPGIAPPEHNVTPRRFRQQLEGMKARGYEFWALDRLLAAVRAGSELHGRIAVVTFDDGYESVYLNAFPILKELGIPATVFVATKYLDGHEPFFFDDWGSDFCSQLEQANYGPLTTDQCHEMLDSQLIEIGAHTHTHEDFRGREEQFGQDLKTSVDIVRDRFGVREVSFAFPFGCPFRGFASEGLVEQAKLAGVTCSLTTEAVSVDLHNDPFHWGRFNAFPWDSAASLAAKVEGWYEWAPRLRRRVSRAVDDSQRKHLSGDS
jgi:peptidoglycan/xylan/chitin deacetylase (PgdA/CDA1 family)